MVGDKNQNYTDKEATSGIILGYREKSQSSEEKPARNQPLGQKERSEMLWVEQLRKPIWEPSTGVKTENLVKNGKIRGSSSNPELLSEVAFISAFALISS